MPTYRRFKDNPEASQGVLEGNLNQKDAFPMQSITGPDKYVTLQTVTAVPQLYVASFTNKLASPVFLNFASFSPILGQSLDITFGSVYNEEGTPSLRFSADGANLDLPIRAQGVAVGKGFNTGTKRSFHATVKTTATVAGSATGQSQDKKTWYIDLDSNVVSCDTSNSGYTTYADGQSVYSVNQINSTLTNLPLQKMGFPLSRQDQCWGYFVKCGTRVFVHIKFILSLKFEDWQTVSTVSQLPKPTKAITVPANGKTGASYSLYIDTNGNISQGGGGGMPIGTYEWDFDYQTS